MKRNYLVLFLSLLGILAIGIFFLIPRHSELEEIPVAEEIIVVPPPINYEYERIPTDSLIMEYGIIKRDQPLSSLLNGYGVAAGRIHELAQNSQGIFDLRKIRAGNRYKVFFSDDSAKSLQYFVYEHTPLDYLGMKFSDSIEVWTGQKKVDTLKRYFSGSIETSLWNLMNDRKVNPMLAVELSEIYAWSIDFFGLQKGDSLRIIYDEYYVDSMDVGIGEIHGACFRHMGTDFWAIPYVQDSISDFFDEKGLSLRKAFLKAPLRFSRISSGFSYSRMHPILKYRRPHLGVDYAAPAGTPVVAIGDGVVVKKGYSGGAGNMVRIKHNSVYSTAYLHLRGYGEGIERGSIVKQGQVIGYVGSTGLSTGPHLDFRFYKNGDPVDPLRVEAPPVDPVREENMSEFQLVRNRVMSELQGFD